jgi:signal transduction histidine kinase
VLTEPSFFEMTCDISSRLAAIQQDMLDDEVRFALRRISGFFLADYALLFSASESRTEILYEVNMETTMSPPDTLAVQNLLPQLFRGPSADIVSECVHLPNDLPESPHNDAHCGPGNVGPLIAVQVRTEPAESYICVLMINNLRQTWTETQAPRFRLLVEILAGAMDRHALKLALQGNMHEPTPQQHIVRVGSWEWDPNSGRILEMETLDRVLGFRPYSQAGFMEHVHPADRERLQRAIDKTHSRQTPARTIQYHLRSLQGDIRIIASRFSLVQSSTGTRMAGSFQDITDTRRYGHELRRMRAQRWHTNRLSGIGLLAASLAHELTQPLAAILTNSQCILRLMSHGHSGWMEIQEALKDVVHDSQRASHVLNAMRAMIQRGNAVRERVEAADLVDDVMVLMHSEFMARQVETRVTAVADCPIRVEATQIVQVLLNLILNSLDAMQRKRADLRRLAIDVKRIGTEEVQISVSDTGTGIPEAQHASVFDPFWSTKPHGIGIGLEICRSIVSAHGGRIWAEQNKGPGATFVFRLPLAETDDPSQRLENGSVVRMPGGSSV